ncbi:histone-like nucleoid-structuring protein Lsr2 [Streptomyces sp. NPDC020422]|uniref:Lsr2 family DNA-binding protein n=1 Tax=Streptomyces sp. NPDC020422 TaxID=3365074 RepID=UPI0037919CB4
MTSIDRLITTCPPPSPPTTTYTDWPAVEQQLGMPLPTDYKQIADTYGPGTFCGFLHLYHPHAHTTWTSLTGPMPSTIRAQLQQEHEQDTPPLPADPQELFPMAVTDNGEYLFWVTRPATSPDAWTVAVNQARSFRWHSYDGTLADFLTAVLSGREIVPVFPSSLLDHGTFFTPLTPAANPTAEQPQPSSTMASSSDIRAWARDHGYEVPDRGRIPIEILDAWQAANTQ